METPPGFLRHPPIHRCAGNRRSPNRTYRNDFVDSANSELYAYDAVNQVKSLQRGALNQNRTEIAASTFTEAWDFDKTGNWDQYNRNGNVESRTHNAANEIQNTVTHDGNGNMTAMPGKTGLKYDAWNRLVEVGQNICYDYNGLNQRIKKTVVTTVTRSFFNENWQELESVTGAETTTYVWGLRYVDDLVYRETPEGRLYALQDSNWNVVALADIDGDVVERMRYDAFGGITWLDTDCSVKSESGYEWNRTFTGQVLDDETGLMLYRMRYYSTVLGRFVNRDPIEYWAGDANLYRYVGNQTASFVDPLGLQDSCKKEAPVNLLSYYPPGFFSWPLDVQLKHLQLQFTELDKFFHDHYQNKFLLSFENPTKPRTIIHVGLSTTQDRFAPLMTTIPPRRELSFDVAGFPIEVTPFDNIFDPTYMAIDALGLLPAKSPTFQPGPDVNPTTGVPNPPGWEVPLDRLFPMPDRLKIFLDYDFDNNTPGWGLYYLR